MSLINRLSARLQNHPKRVVFPEGEDIRILKAARQFANRKLGVPVLLGSKETISKMAQDNEISLDGIRIIEISKSDDYEALRVILKGMPKFRQSDDSSLDSFLNSPGYFAALMLATGRADAMVSGVTQTAANSLRPVFQIISRQPSIKTISSMTIVETNKPEMGANGVIFLADCGVVPEPDENQLSEIAITTARLANHLTDVQSKVAMLSFVSKINVAKTKSVMKMKSATALAHKLARDNNLDIEIDGELQVDAALLPESARIRGISSSVAGQANVLVFPDLNSGNIASKFISVIGCVRTYGQILTGLNKPVAEIPRGAIVEDIYGAAVIVAAQAVDKKYLFPEEI
jgi:Phosphotransacetylase